MSDLVDSSDVERIVGVERHEDWHYGRAVSEDRMVYVLHSRICVAGQPDLRDCVYSTALDNGIDLERWQGFFDMPVELAIADWRLIPFKPGTYSALLGITDLEVI